LRSRIFEKIPSLEIRNYLRRMVNLKSQISNLKLLEISNLLEIPVSSKSATTSAAW